MFGGADVHCWAKTFCGLVINSNSAKLIAAAMQIVLFVFCEFIFMFLTSLINFGRLPTRYRRWF